MITERVNPMIMYHYTNNVRWENINRGDPGFTCEDPRTGKYVDGKDIRGLWPSRRLIAQGVESSLVPFEATKPTIFGLLEEKPMSWIQYKELGLSGHTGVFSELMKHCSRRFGEPGERSLVLLRVDLEPEDEPFVVDYHYLRTFARDFSSETNPSKLNISLAERNKMYWESRVSLTRYRGNYFLPEVCVMAPIPLERVHFVWERDVYQFLEEIYGVLYPICLEAIVEEGQLDFENI